MCAITNVKVGGQGTAPNPAARAACSLAYNGFRSLTASANNHTGA